MLIPVGVIVAFVAHRTLVRVSAHVGPEVLNAHDAPGALGRGANLVIHVISAANAARGRGGRNGSGGAHAHMISQRPAICKRVERNFYKHHRPRMGAVGGLGLGGGLYISPHPALASQSLSASQSSRLIRLAASLNAWLSASRSASS